MQECTILIAGSTGVGNKGETRMKKLLALFSAAALLLFGLIAAPLTAQSNDNRDRVVVLTNFTNATIYRIHASRSDLRDWQEDMLGSNILKSGESVAMNVDDGSGGCMYDIKVVFASDMVHEIRQVNVCAISLINVWPDGIEVE
jgi:hypothetical protein